MISYGYHSKPFPKQSRGKPAAGKSTLLRAICGLLRPKRRTVHFEGRDITGWPADKTASLGIVMVREGRKIFADLTVEENMRLGAYCRNDTDAIEQDLKLMESYFAVLAAKRSAKGSKLSGGQQRRAGEVFGRGLVG